MDYSIYKERLNSKLIENNGCKEYQGYLFNGYGKIMIGSRTDGSRKTIAAHRLAYLIEFKSIPNNLFVCHKCDNRKCCNTNHLFLGTIQDNNKDRENKNRGVYFKGENCPRALLTNAQAEEIRLKYNTDKISMRKLAKEYKIKNHHVILNVVKNKTYLPQKP